jgi:hypothetical protein
VEALRLLRELVKTANEATGGAVWARVKHWSQIRSWTQRAREKYIRRSVNHQSERPPP